MNEKDLDTLFKSKLAERSFEYNPKAWQAMEQLLDSRQRNLAFYWRTAAMVLAFFGLSMLVALNQNPVKATNGILKPVVVAPKVEKDKAKTQGNTLENGKNNTLDISDKEIPFNDKNITKTTNLKRSNSIAVNKAQETTQVFAIKDYKEEHMEETKNILEKDVTELSTQNTINNNKSLLALPVLGYSLVTTDNKTLLIKSNHNPLALASAKKWAYPFLRISGLSSSINFNATNGYGFSLGAGLDKPLSAKWSISASINYVQRTKPGLQKTSDSVKYTFTESHINYQEEIFQIQHLEIPISINYLFANRHRIGAGVSFGYLLNAVAYQQREENNFKSLVSRNQDISAPKLYNLAELNWSTHLQYHFLIAKRVSLGTSVHYSFTDFTLETTEKQHLSDVRLFLHYAF